MGEWKGQGTGLLMRSRTGVENLKSQLLNYHNVKSDPSASVDESVQWGYSRCIVDERNDLAPNHRQTDTPHTTPRLLPPRDGHVGRLAVGRVRCCWW